MSTIPTSLTEKQFNEHVRPYISTAKRGFECKYLYPRSSITSFIDCTQVVNGINFQLHPIQTIQKKRSSVMTRFTTIFVSGAETVAYKRSGKAVL